MTGMPKSGGPATRPITTMWVMTSLDRLTYTYEDTNGYDLEIKNIPRSWGDLIVKQYRIDNDNNMELVDSWTVEKKYRGQRSVRVSGDWVHSEPDPELNPDGAAQGIDMIVVYGETKHHCGKH